MNDDRLNIICAVFIEFDTVHSAVSCSDLVLPAACLVAENSLKVYSLIGKSLLICILAFERIESIEHAYGK